MMFAILLAAFLIWFVDQMICMWRIQKQADERRRAKKCAARD
jgi:hypothetical protein